MTDKQFIENEYEKYLKDVESKMNKNTTTNNIELNHLCKYLFKNNFRGVVPSDKIPKLKNGQSCIVNLDNSNQPGSHWTAVYKSKGKTIFYDSFGRGHKTILKPLKNTHKTIKNTEDDAEQNIVETNCGQRCIAFLLICYKYGINQACYI